MSAVRATLEAMEAVLLVLVVLAVALGIASLALGTALLRRDRGVDAQPIAEAVRAELRASGAELRQDLAAQRTELGEQLRHEREERQASGRELRQELELSMTAMRQDSQARLEGIRETVDKKLRENAERVEALTKGNADKHLELQAVLRRELDTLRRENEAKLEQMRETVDEKLQGTLEKRLGESFSLVSQRLEEVQKGLGEMQTLASDVGGLKKVLTNVKNRGGWGEVQLERQLEDILTREQYEANVAIRPETGERVEFAVRLPGRDEGGSVVFLPIDSKFPQEDYERLLDAQERGEKSEVDDAGRALERALVEQAKTIARKYIHPPQSTDFAIMYLPTEGLFAEAVRRPGLASRLQAEHRVMLTGPSTLMSLLNSLQMGFRTLAIERRSSEVWQVLAAAKAEFRKYGDVWAKLEKQLQTAQNTVSEAGRRTRAVERRLRGVEALELAGTDPLALADLGAPDEESADPGGTVALPDRPESIDEEDSPLV